MRIGLFGGSFDPVHYGHLLLAECCREQQRLDRVLFIPSAISPHKQERVLSPGTQRAEMLDLAIGGHERFSVSRHEIDRGGVSYTVDTLRQFQNELPSNELFLLLGADMLYDLPHWREAAGVCEMAQPIVVRRAGVPPPDFNILKPIAPPERIEAFRHSQVEMPTIAFSSTEIRRRVEAGLSIRYWTPRAVEMYIQAHGLYRQSQTPDSPAGERQ
jgi:nicotinate-nucleotide adenylyltransferase